MKTRQLFLSALALTTLAFGSCKDDEASGISSLNKDSGSNVAPPSSYADLTQEQKDSINSVVDASLALKKDPGFFVPNEKYKDNYVSYSGWIDKSKWNLANVHDPSVVYYHGMYYMWGTDASWGNEHLQSNSGRHYPGKRSYDLVSWEYNPGPFHEAPDWAVDTLNAYRERLGVKSGLKKEDFNWLYWAPVVRVVNVDGVDVIRMYYAVGSDNFLKSGEKQNVDKNTNLVTNFDGSWTDYALIGMCETTNPSGGPSSWIDKGYVTASSSDRGKDFRRNNMGDWNAYFYFNAIDPSYIVTPEGRHYLCYGSWHSGFAMMEVDPTTGKSLKMDPVNGLGNPWSDNATELQQRFGKRVAARNNGRWQGSEAPEIIYKDGYYYMFMAWDELAFKYNTRVVRAENVEGPYFTSRGENYSTGNAQDKVYPIVTHPYKFKNSVGWCGISHCCVFQTQGKSDGDWFYMSQQRPPENVWGIPLSNALMMGGVRKLVWCPASPEELDNLWPIALPERYAAVESDGKYKAPITSEEIAGKYEVINLGYNGKEKNDCIVSSEETNLVFNADGTMSGYITGTWEFDPATKYLKVTSSTGKFPGSGNNLGSMILCVERELDWENGVVTLVFAGFHKLHTNTFWGKKVANLAK